MSEIHIIAKIPVGLLGEFIIERVQRIHVIGCAWEQMTVRLETLSFILFLL